MTSAPESPSQQKENIPFNDQPKDKINLVDAWLANLLYQGYIDQEHLAYLKAMSQKKPVELGGGVSPQDYQNLFKKIKRALQEGRLKLWEKMPQVERQRIENKRELIQGRGVKLSVKDEFTLDKNIKGAHYGLATPTLDSVKTWSELNAPTLEEGDRVFQDKTRRLWQSLAVHGAIDRRSGRIVKRPDLDSSVALNLLALADIDITKSYWVKPGGQSGQALLQIDIGNRQGISIEKDEQGRWKIYLDHHGTKKRIDISAASETYRALQALDLLKSKPELDRLIEFTIDVDNETHPAFFDKEHFQRSDRTLLGLVRFLDLKNNQIFAELLDFFKQDKDPASPLSDRELEEFGLLRPREGEKYSPVERQRQVIQETEEIIPELRKKGYEVETKWGKFLVDIGGRLRSRSIGAKAYGYGGYLIYTPAEKNFSGSLFISQSVRRREKKPAFTLGLVKKIGQKELHLIRGVMMIKNYWTRQKLTVKLGHILRCLGAKEINGELEQYIYAQDNPNSEFARDFNQMKKIEANLQRQRAQLAKLKKTSPHYGPLQASIKSREGELSLAGEKVNKLWQEIATKES